MNEMRNMVVKYSLQPDDDGSSKINKKFYVTKNASYLLLNYDKRYMCFDDTKAGLYRSVVFSYPEKKILCFSPPKSTPFTIFINKHSLINEEIVINEKIEGIMITIFYDSRIKKWEMATKSAIGGKNWFYGKKIPTNENTMFLTMLLDALKSPYCDDINDNNIISSFSKDYCYTFVVKHPNNIILYPVSSPMIYLVSVYKTIHNEIEYVPCNIYESWAFLRNAEGIINFPKKWRVDDYCSIMNEMSEYQNNLECPGYMITNVSTGERTKVDNKRYIDLKNILLVRPKVQYQYLCLARLGREKIDEYIKFFPKMKNDFYIVRYEYEKLINSVYKYYIANYIDKTDYYYIEKYESHIYKLHHNVYLESLTKKPPLYINKKVVKDYFNKMEPRELLFLLNWDQRDIS